MSAQSLEDLRKAVRQPYLTVYLDGRNEHGSHVLPMAGDNIGCPKILAGMQEDLENQSLGISEEIIQQSEALGYQIGNCVVTIWRLTGAGPEDYFEWQSVHPELSEFFCGSPGEQRAELAKAMEAATKEQA